MIFLSIDRQYKALSNDKLFCQPKSVECSKIVFPSVKSVLSHTVLEVEYLSAHPTKSAEIFTKFSWDLRPGNSVLEV